MRDVNPHIFIDTSSSPESAVAFNAGPLHDGLEESMGIFLADAAGDGAKIGECLAQDKTDHGVVLRAGLQMIGERSKTFGAVEIVGVDGCERLADLFFSGEEGLGCTPRLCATGRQGESRRKRVEFLKGI